MPERTQAGQTQAATQGASATRAPAATANPRQATAQADYLKSLQKQPGTEGAAGPGDAAATATSFAEAIEVATNHDGDSDSTAWISACWARGRVKVPEPAKRSAMWRARPRR